MVHRLPEAALQLSLVDVFDSGTRRRWGLILLDSFLEHEDEAKDEVIAMPIRSLCLLGESLLRHHLEARKTSLHYAFIRIKQKEKYYRVRLS